MRERYARPTARQRLEGDLDIGVAARVILPAFAELPVDDQARWRIPREHGAPGCFVALAVDLVDAASDGGFDHDVGMLLGADGRSRPPCADAAGEQLECACGRCLHLNGLDDGRDAHVRVSFSSCSCSSSAKAWNAPSARAQCASSHSRHRPDPARIEMIDAPGALRGLPDQSGLLQNLQMLRDGGPADRQSRGKLADRHGSLRHAFEDRATGRIAKGGKTLLSSDSVTHDLPLVCTYQ